MSKRGPQSVLTTIPIDRAILDAAGYLAAHMLASRMSCLPAVPERVERTSRDTPTIASIGGPIVTATKFGNLQLCPQLQDLEPPVLA
mmetsp:Transcript_41650/g.75601  ORF Transcript_41650/g.75601 Transcript_41650/m.75601 type:complete len:87 (+) Transcript_41650:1062-1322(+)